MNRTAHQKMLDKMSEAEIISFRQKDNERKKTRYPYQRWKHIKRRYGLTKEDYEELLEKQNGTCAICNQVDHDKSLHVDHDHNSGMVRGLLCVRCNTMLGKARDNINILLTAIKYLEKGK